MTPTTATTPKAVTRYISSLDGSPCTSCGSPMERTYTDEHLKSETVLFEQPGGKGLLPIRLGEGEWTCTRCGEKHRETVAFMIPLGYQV